jgi:epoxyqueuosine reductase
LDACPTGALTTNGLDARKCISYHTIESKTEIPSNIKEKITSQAFGCDICQDVCPYNQKVMPHSHSELKILPQIKNLSLGNLENMSETDFNVLFSESALMRAGKAKLIWNFESLKFLK